MSRFLYLNLACQSMRKNYRVYVPFLCGSILMVCMVYSICSLSSNPALGLSEFGARSMQTMLSLGSHVLEIFTLIFYFYLNSVWNRQRQQENGLFSILGMEKRHLIRILAYQMLLSAAAALVLGVLLGIVMDKVFTLVILRLFDTPPVEGFHFSLEAAGETVLWTLGSYLLIFLLSVVQLFRKNPLDLTRSSDAGEKRVKTRWVYAVLGVICLAIGYTMAQVIQDPIEAMAYFFIAVLFVIAGTYLLFLFGTTVLLTMMQNAKGYYYKTSHFISVSSMKYRLRRNAAALANIAILSTMILITLSTTVSLMIDLDSGLKSVYARDARIVFLSPDPIENTAQAVDKVRIAADSAGLQPDDVIGMEMTAARRLNPEGGEPKEAFVFSLDDFNTITGQNLQLQPGQIISVGSAHSVGKQIELAGTDLNGTPVTIQETIDRLPDDISKPYTSMASTEFYIGRLEDLPIDHRICEVQFNVANPDELTEEQRNGFYKSLEEQGLQDAGGMLSWRTTDTEEIIATYVSLLFVGLYLSAMFILAVILIMYYKQISEGLEDQKRFAILQNVGLEPKQIRKVINDQVLILFFLPLATALIHIFFAYPMISKIMALLSIQDSSLFLIVLLTCFALFALIYVIIYRLTARTYFKLTCRS